MIFYFSGTGNSLYIAEKVQEKIGGELISIRDAYKNNKFEYYIHDGEKVGIVYPVYYYTSAKIIRDFLSKLKLNSADSVFLITNCGGSTGKANEILESILNKNNISVNSKFSILMPSNYILLSDVKSDDEIESILNIADNEISNIIDKIINNEKGDFNNHKGFLPGISSPLASSMYPFFAKTKKFNIKLDECIGCSKCKHICPSDAIVMEKCKPVWVKDKCAHCVACINRCPQHCINYGKSTVKRGRYVNPRVKFDDFRM